MMKGDLEPPTYPPDMLADREQNYKIPLKPLLA